MAAVEKSKSITARRRPTWLSAFIIGMEEVRRTTTEDGASATGAYAGRLAATNTASMMVGERDKTAFVVREGHPSPRRWRLVDREARDLVVISAPSTP